MSQEFITHDGADANGVRAEVVVIKGRGKVKEATLGNNDKSVQVFIFEENLKLPIKGWANVGTPIHDEINRALASGEDIDYRIEIQRKNAIDRALTMEEVRPKGDMVTANKNAIRILAQLGDVVSEEAVTHPSEDQASSFGRHKATGAEQSPNATPGGSGASISPATVLEGLRSLAGGNATPDVVAAALGAAIALGVNVSDALKAVTSDDNSSQERPIQRGSYSSEAKPWDLWNSDGNENLGHARFAAGTGAEGFVRGQLAKAEIKDAALEDGTAYFTGLVLSIADRVQVKAYGDGFRPDRASGSHARIRGIVYDTIENYYPFPLKATDNVVDDIKAWIGQVGSQAFERLQIVITASNAPTNFSAALPELIFGKQAVTQPKVEVSAPVKEKESEPAKAKPVEEPKSSKVAAEVESIPEVVETPEVEVTEEQPVVVAAEVEESVAEPATDTTVEEDDAPLELFPPIDVASLPEEIRNDLATEDTIAYFRALIEETEIPDSQLKLVASLLRKTFGNDYSKAQQLPETVLGDFIDFYSTSGTENLRKAIQNS